ncbi:MAG: EF-Tu/IF-2/RF-3 family GTPase [Candidatus Bilamarchaeaceae archaeon]
MFFAVLSDKPEVRERFCKAVGKETGKDDIAFYSVNFGGKINTIVEPTLYPQKIQPLVYALYIADYVVVLADQLTPQLGEIIVALDTLKKDRGMLVTQLNLPIKGTVLEKYDRIADETTAKQKLFGLQAEESGEGELLAFVDKYINVKSVGNVALGVIKEGKIKKHDTLIYLPEKKELEVRSIQLNDNDVEEAVAGDRFGIAYKGEPIERGMLVSLRSEFENSKNIMGRFNKNPFYKDDLNRKLSFFYSFQSAEGTVLENSISLDKEIAYRKRDPLLVVDASNQKLRIVGSFTPV